MSARLCHPGGWVSDSWHGNLAFDAGAADGKLAEKKFLAGSGGLAVRHPSVRPEPIAYGDNDDSIVGGDLVCGEFVDRLRYFESVRARAAPKYAAGRFIAGANGDAMRIDACMISPLAYDFDGDGDLLPHGQNVTLMRNVATTKGAFAFRDDGRLDTAILAGHDIAPGVGDFDGEGVPDLVVGAEDGFVYLLKNPNVRGADAAAAP